MSKQIRTEATDLLFDAILSLKDNIIFYQIKDMTIASRPCGKTKSRALPVK